MGVVENSLFKKPISLKVHKDYRIKRKK